MRCAAAWPFESMVSAQRGPSPSQTTVPAGKRHGGWRRSQAGVHFVLETSDLLRVSQFLRDARWLAGEGITDEDRRVCRHPTQPRRRLTKGLLTAGQVRKHGPPVRSVRRRSRTGASQSRASNVQTDRAFRCANDARHAVVASLHQLQIMQRSGLFRRPSFAARSK